MIISAVRLLFAKTRANITSPNGLAIGFGSLVAEVPRLINYQGHASQSDGDSNLTLTFSLFPAPSGGESLWQEVHTITPSNGVFNVLLGSLEPLPDSIFQQEDLYLSLATETEGELLPRQQLVSVAFAIRASEAENVASTTITPSAIQLSDGTGFWDSSGTLATVLGKLGSLVVGEAPVINSEGKWIGPGSEPVQATNLDSILIIDLPIDQGSNVVFFDPEFESVGFDQFLDVEGPVDLEFQLRLQLVTNFPFEVRLGYKQVTPVNVVLGPIGPASAGLSSTGKIGTTVQTYGLLRNVESGNYRIWVEGRGDSNVTATVVRGQIIVKFYR